MADFKRVELVLQNGVGHIQACLELDDCLVKVHASSNTQLRIGNGKNMLGQ